MCNVFGGSANFPHLTACPPGSYVPPSLMLPSSVWFFYCSEPSLLLLPVDFPQLLVGSHHLSPPPLPPNYSITMNQETHSQRLVFGQQKRHWLNCTCYLWPLTWKCSLRLAVLKRIAVHQPFISCLNGMGCRSKGLSYWFKKKSTAIRMAWAICSKKIDCRSNGLSYLQNRQPFELALSITKKHYSAVLVELEWRRGGLVVSVLNFWSRGRWFEPGHCRCVVSLDKNLIPHCLSSPRCISGYQRS